MKQTIDVKKKLLAEGLQELAKDVTVPMKVEAEGKFGLGRTTINDYLKGDVRNIPTGQALVKLFRKRIIELPTPQDIRA